MPKKRTYYIEDAFQVSAEEVHRFFRARANHIFETVPIREQAAETLHHLKEIKHTVHLITARDERHRAITEEWLGRHRVPYDRLFMSPPKQTFSKGDLCKELKVGFFVDDKLENALETASQGIYTLLFQASHNAGSDHFLPLVKNWGQYVNILTST